MYQEFLINLFVNRKNNKISKKINFVKYSSIKNLQLSDTRKYKFC